MSERNIIVVGCSVGGVEALRRLVGGLPPNFPAIIFVVLHLAPQGTSVLPDILNREGTLRAVHPEDGAPVRMGNIYVAPPDRHLLIENEHIRLSRGPKENRHRPAVDPLFRSAARWYGPRVIGIVLSGALDDGTAGLLSVKKRGGIAIVQDPDDAICGDMPRSAIENADVDYVVTVDEIPEVLKKLVTVNVEENGRGRSTRLKKETEIAEFNMAAIEDENRPGVPSPFACPECGGVLWELKEQKMLRYRCRVGHAYAANSLAQEQSEQVEAALWAALRALEEGASLAKNMAERAAREQHIHSQRRYLERAEDKMEQAGLLRKLILENKDKPMAMEENAS